MIKKVKKKETEPELKDYLAIFIALLETTFLPFVIIIIIFMVVVFILLLFF